MGKHDVYFSARIQKRSMFANKHETCNVYWFRQDLNANIQRKGGTRFRWGSFQSGQPLVVISLFFVYTTWNQIMNKMICMYVLESQERIPFQVGLYDIKRQSPSVILNIEKHDVDFLALDDPGDKTFLFIHIGLPFFYPIDTSTICFIISSTSQYYFPSFHGFFLPLHFPPSLPSLYLFTNAQNLILIK